MRISWTQAWKVGVVKEEKNVLGAGVCGSLVLAFLTVALEGDENSDRLTFWLCHDPGSILNFILNCLASFQLCSNRITE